MNNDKLDSLRYAYVSGPSMIERMEKFGMLDRKKKNDPMSVFYSIQIGDEISHKFKDKGIICIEELNHKFIRVITDKGKVGVSIKHENDYHDYDFGVTMAFTRAIDGNRGLDFRIPFSNDTGRYELPKPETKSEKKDMYKLIMYWIGDNPLTKDVSDYNEIIPRTRVLEKLYEDKECD
jgi:hypothetical protein